jgi:hypothetical protein
MPKHGTVLGIFISPKRPTRQRFVMFYFPPKAQHGNVLAILISPQKPTRRRFGDQLSHQIAHVGPAFFLSFFGLLSFFFLFWFGLSGLMGLGFCFWHVNILYIGLLYNNGFGLFK